jgi:hypothetical protein
MSLSPYVTSSSSIAAIASSSHHAKPVTSQNPPTTPKTTQQKHIKIVEKILSDLEELGRKLIDIHRGVKHQPSETTDQDGGQTTSDSDDNNGEDRTIRDDCYELQKFCFKLEFLLQFELKEKKGFLTSSSNNGTPNPSASSDTPNLANCVNREYWTFLHDVLKSSRSFQDAIKYVKSVYEIKSSLGRGRAFIRFCLQYHRLADAVQQLMMENKVVG